MGDERSKIARRVTWVGFFLNLALTIFKLTAGIVGKSTAMVADAIHSLSDFVTDVIVIVFIGISGKAKDEDHKYGHGKYETFATLLISLALLLVGGTYYLMFSQHFGIVHCPFHHIGLAAIVCNQSDSQLLFHIAYILCFHTAKLSIFLKQRKVGGKT